MCVPCALVNAKSINVVFRCRLNANISLIRATSVLNRYLHFLNNGCTRIALIYFGFRQSFSFKSYLTEQNDDESNGASKCLVIIITFSSFDCYVLSVPTCTLETADEWNNNELNIHVMYIMYPMTLFTSISARHHNNYK